MKILKIALLCGFSFVLVQIASMFSVKYFCSQQTIVEEEIQEVELRFVVRNLQARSCTRQSGTQKKEYFYGRISRKISFLRDRGGGGAGRAVAPPLFCAPAPTF